MKQPPETSQDDLRTYHKQHMLDGQSCYFTLQNGHLQPRHEQIHWLTAHRQKIERLLCIQSTDYFVDVGCGEGYLTLPLATKTQHGFSFDFTASALTVLQNQPQYDSHRLLLTVAPGDSLPLPNASVDKILCNHMLEHVLDDDAVVREFYRIIRPEGLLLVGVPLALSPQVRFLIWLRRWLRPKAPQLQLERVQPGQLVPELIGIQSHVRFYSLTAVYHLLERNGFDVLQAEGIGLSMRGNIPSIIRRHRLLFNLTTIAGYVFPSIGDGVLVLARKKQP